MVRSIALAMRLEPRGRGALPRSYARASILRDALLRRAPPRMRVNSAFVGMPLTLQSHPQHAVAIGSAGVMREHVVARSHCHSLQPILVGECCHRSALEPAWFDVVIDAMHAFEQRRMTDDGRLVHQR